MSNVDTEIEAVDPVVTETPVEAPPEGPGSGRSGLRKQLEKNFETDRKATEKADKAAAAKKPAAAKETKRIAGGAELEAPEAEAEPVEGAEGEAEKKPATPAPEAFSKEAKAEWAKTPPAVQAAILKREIDTAKGVEELKGRYKDIDSALAPHINAIRQHGHTPAQATAQLFGWFQALAANPQVAFPALAKSFGYDLAKFVPQQQQPAAAGDPAAQQQQPAVGAIPPELQKYIEDLKSEVGQLRQAFSQELTSVKGTFQQQSEAKTNEILMNWAKDKPHFEKARGLMAQLIQSGAVPPLKDGQVDLDGAYDMALYANPELRAEILAAQEAEKIKTAKAKAAAAAAKQQEDVNKARRAGTSLSGGAPGEAGAPAAKKGKGKSVRESIMEAREQLTE